MTKVTDYIGNKIYEQGVLKKILVDGGYIEDGKYYFTQQDHLGNTRMVLSQEGSIVQREYYYPFGMTVPHIEYDGKHPYRYNGKELDQMHRLDLYDYSARYYDQAIGRFTTVDPLAEKYYSWSPYNYVGNNPIRRVDPDGKDWIDRIMGVGMGVVTNNIPGTTSLRNVYTPNDVVDYNGALQATDNAAVAVGAAMIVVGVFDMSAGSGTAGAGGIIAATGLGASVGGIVAGAGGIVVAGGAAEVVGGAVLLGNAYLNKQAGYDYGRVSEASGSGGNNSQGARRKNRIPDKGEPNTVESNNSGTTMKKYGPDGNVQKEWNKGHSKDKNPKGLVDHIHDYKPNPNNPTGRGDRQPARTKYNNNDKRDFNLK